MFKETVVVTGSSGGIGLATARKFAKNGCNVVLNDCKSQQALEAVVSELRGVNSNVMGVIADVSDYSQVLGMFERVRECFGCVDVLINNAAVAHIGLFTEMSPHEWRHIIDTNMISVFNCCHLALPDMIRRRKGVIVNISSIWGGAGASCEAVYAASKGGINGFTKSLAKELAMSNIRVNAVACGVIDTSMNAALTNEERACLEYNIPMGRFGTPVEIADVVYYLSSNEASYVTGQIITADGGWY